MRALCLTSIGNLSLRERLAPPVDALRDEVVLRVTHCALCRTDAAMWQKGHRDLLLPRVPGHEICGQLPGASDHYTLWPGVSCGTCEFCLHGMENLCASMQIIGFHRDGGLADYVRTPRSGLLKVPEGLRPDLATLAEPLACTLNALQQSRLQRDDRVLVVGAGPLGLLMCLALTDRGAEVCLLEKAPSRIEKIKPFCRGLGLPLPEAGTRQVFDVVINATASLSSFYLGMEKLKPAGRFCFFSGFTGPAEIPVHILNEIHYRQLSVSGAYGCTRAQMEEALVLLHRYRDTVPLLIEGFVGPEGVVEFFPMILNSEVLKIVVQFGDGKGLK